MRFAAEEVYGDDADRIFTADTRDLMGFFITLRRLLVECGIKDFTFADIYKPTYPRLVKIFSYIINFIRFRESQTSVIDQHYNSSERTKNDIEQLYQANQEKAEQLEDMQQNRKNVESALKEKEKRTGELRTRLLELKASQERVTDKLERVKGEQAKLKSVLEERTVSVMNTRQEASKLRPYTEQSPAVLEQSLRDLSGSLNRDRAEIDRLDKRNRALQTSSDSFSLLQTDITSLTRILSDLSVELQKEEEEGQKAGKNRDALTEQTNSVREVERKEKMLRKQLEQWQGRTEKLRTDTERKSTNARQKMEDLRAVHIELGTERSVRGDEVEKRRVRIEQTEKKVSLDSVVELANRVLTFLPDG
jgi:kinetochore protein Nuf2